MELRILRQCLNEAYRCPRKTDSRPANDKGDRMESPEIVTDFRTRDKQTLDKELNAAVETAIQRALPQRKGVLVTRHDASRFTVTVTTEVPFGLIYEHDHSAPSRKAFDK